jgi:protein SCO1
MRRQLIVLLGGILLVVGAGTARLQQRGEAIAAESSRGGEVWGADYFPNVPLTTHEGRAVHFFDDLLRDRVVAINFVYTSCPDSCPLETAKLQEVYKLLGDRMGKDVFFYSVSIDPENDTPAVLGEFAKKWKIGPGWTFLTGSAADIEQLRRKMGVFDEGQPLGSRDHNLSLWIGNQSTGRWMKRSPFENPYVLAAQLGSWLHNWKQPSTATHEYADVPELRDLATGEDLFRTRCAACHTIGGGDIDAAEQRRAGPDLLGVHERRERAWLERWIAAPDAMLAQGDPIAQELRGRYSGLSMPNLRLTPRDIGDVLEFIRTETERIRSTSGAE